MFLLLQKILTLYLNIILVVVRTDTTKIHRHVVKTKQSSILRLMIGRRTSIRLDPLVTWILQQVQLVYAVHVFGIPGAFIGKLRQGSSQYARHTVGIFRYFIRVLLLFLHSANYYPHSKWHFLFACFLDHQIRINKLVRSGIFWIMHGKLLKGNKDARTIRLIVPCKSGKLNKTRDYLLLTDSTIDGETLRLGDSDLLLQNHLRLRKIIPKKQRTCRKLSLFVRQFQKAKKEINEIIRKMIRPLRSTTV